MLDRCDLSGSGRAGERGAVRGDEFDRYGVGGRRQDDHVGAPIRLGQDVRYGGALRRDEPVRVDDDLRVRHAGEDLREVLLQEDLVVVRRVAGQKDEPARSIREIQERARIELIGCAQAHGEDFVGNRARDVADVLRSVS